MAAADLRPGEREESLASIPPPDLKAGEREEPIDAGPRTIGKPAATRHRLQRPCEPSVPWRCHCGEKGEVLGQPSAAEEGRFALHAAPYAAAALGPEGIAAGAAVQGVTGAAEEFGVQTIDHLTGKRKEYDWPAVAWNAGWNTVAAAAGGWIGKQVGSLTGKLAAQAPKAQELIAAGETVTPKRIAGIAQQASDELKSKTMLDSLGQKLGMTEEQSAKLTNAYDEGRQVGDAVFQTDRMIQGEFKQRYDAILGPHNATAVDQSAINASIDGSAQWTQQHGMEGHIRPSIGSLLDRIKAGMPPPEDSIVDTDIELPGGEMYRAGGQGASMDVAKARGWQSVLRRLDRTTNLTDAEESVVAKTEKAITRTIADVVQNRRSKSRRKTRSGRRRLRRVQVQLPIPSGKPSRTKNRSRKSAMPSTTSTVSVPMRCATCSKVRIARAGWTTCAPPFSTKCGESRRRREAQPSGPRRSTPTSRSSLPGRRGRTSCKRFSVSSRA